MRGRKMSRSKSRNSFKSSAGTHKFNINGHVERGGIRL